MQGWVAYLEEALRKRFRSRVGKDAAVWRDPDIRPNEDFEQKISRRLAKTATLLTIISPSFFQRKWCVRELEEFAENAAQKFGIWIGEKSRILKVEKLPVERSQFPEPLRKTKTYRFYSPDPETKIDREFRPQLGDARSFLRAVDDLACDIAAVLKTMAEKKTDGENSSTSGSLAVYLAETTADLDEEASQVRRELEARGYIVLPAGDLPYRAKDFKDRVRDSLQRSTLSVHLVGEEYGFIPEGEIEKSNEWLQSDLAIERSQTPPFRRVIWMPPGLKPNDPRQRRFLEYLRDDEAAHEGADVLETNLDDLKTALTDSLRTIRHQTARRTPEQAEPEIRDELIRVYLLCDQLDLTSSGFRTLRKYLFTQGYECKLSSVDDDEREAKQRHLENLQECDAFLIYYGAGSERWFEAMLRDFWTFLSRRQKPVLSKAVYLAPPLTPSKEDVETHEASILRGSEPFSPESIDPFLRKLRAPRRGHA